MINAEHTCEMEVSYIKFVVSDPLNVEKIQMVAVWCITYVGLWTSREGAETTKVVQMVAEVRWVCETLEIEKVDQKSAQ